MKMTIRICAVLLLFVMCAFAFVSCADKCEDDGDGNGGSTLDYSDIDVAAYVTLGEYKGIEIRLDSADAQKGAAVWNTVVENAEITDYPEGPLKYYISQAEKRYKHYAVEGDMEYSEVLESLGITQKDIEDDAKKLVKEDLVQLAIIKAEGIEITEDEKAKFLDKYVEKYVTNYGYSEDYVRKNLIEEIYKSMIYDKMIEYLVLKNTFITEE